MCGLRKRALFCKIRGRGERLGLFGRGGGRETGFVCIGTWSLTHGLALDFLPHGLNRDGGMGKYVCVARLRF